MSQYLKAPPFEYVALIVEGQLMVVIGLSLLIMFLLIYRNWNKKHVDRIKEDYAEQLITEMLSLAENAASTYVLASPKWHEFRKKQALRTVLLDHLRAVTGSEKSYLAKRYEELGLLKQDIYNSQSLFWWKRLKSISNLSLLDSEKFGPIFHRLTTDRNELVAAFAYIPLSASTHPINQVKVLSDLPKNVLERKNVVHEIIRNWTRLFGFQVLIEQIPKISHPELISLLVRAISGVQSPEIAAEFTKYLHKSYLLPADAIEQMLITLKQVGDPESASVVKKFLRFPSDGVRLRAVEYLLFIGDEDPILESRVMTDTSHQVQRAVKELKNRRAI